ncbi:MAG: hypothetical protein WCY57_01875 [Micavibrio sp.]
MPENDGYAQSGLGNGGLSALRQPPPSSFPNIFNAASTHAAADADEPVISTGPTHADMNDELWQQMSGNYLENPNIYAARFNASSSLYEGEDSEDSAKKKYKDAAYVRAALTAEPFRFSGQQVVDYLSKSLDFDKTWKNMHQHHLEVSPEQMLHVKDGKRIDPSEDPEGKYLVRTTEEKEAFETSIKGCSAYFAQEEVGYAGGKRVNINYAKEIEILDTQIARKEDVIARVERGELAPEDIDADLQEEIKQRAAGQEPEMPQLGADNLLDSISSFQTSVDLGPEAVTPQTPPMEWTAKFKEFIPSF